MQAHNNDSDTVTKSVIGRALMVSNALLTGFFKKSMRTRRLTTFIKFGNPRLKIKRAVNRL
jgi:hypothetical protein